MVSSECLPPHLTIKPVLAAKKSTPSGSRVKPCSIYDINPEDISECNRFDILNALDDSFIVLCDESGHVSPIIPAPPPSDIFDKQPPLPHVISPFLDLFG
ncbi:hypothetical protein L2E82_35892 [Cichorium intybus]|uniref:Uncharacterized protein n=1 Tax=Cichorium intybus TaxID=13427 RepID=A0ACB9BQ30_CICIN|nr:hypothetical protein L2E82_35892 [Cichorium intybus]